MFQKSLLGLVAMCALAGATAAQAQKPGGVANAIIQPEPPGLMLAIVQNGPTQMVAGNIYEGLLRYNDKLAPQPGLAESWKISDDGKVYTFNLAKGATWHDGKPFTSADVVFTLEFIKQTNPRARANLVHVDKVEAPDANTVVITLKQPFQGRKHYKGLLGRADTGWTLVFDDGKGEQVLGFALDEVREARLVPVVDFKGRKGRKADAAGSAASAPQDGGQDR